MPAILGHEHARRQPPGDFGRHDVHAAPVMLHRHVLEMLLDGGHGQNGPLQLATVHALAKLAARQLA